LIELNKDNWEEHIPNSAGWALVDFWSPKCVPCMNLMPDIKALAEKYEDKMNFYSLDTTKARRLSMAQGVMSLPVIAFYHNGEKKHEFSGEFTAEDIEKKIQEIIG
jgi:thioredoxin 1